MSLDPARLEADCTACAALCCVAFAFDKSHEFGHDKKANQPCKHLDTGFGCSIHGQLGQKGYGGCVRFDCHGAGQRVVKDLYGGRDWRSEPELLAPMAETFRAMRRLHELLIMLRAAGDLALEPETEGIRMRMIAALDPDPAWTAESFAQFDIDTADGAISGFLRSLAMRMGGQ